MPSDPQSFHDASAIIPALEAAFMDFEAVEERLVEAMRVVLRSGDREWSWLHPRCQAIFREYRPEDAEVEARPLDTCMMTRAEVARAEEAMGWVVDAVPAGEARRIMGVALT